MTRCIARLLSACLLLAPASVWAQGLLIDIQPAHRIRLPRPIVPHPRLVPEPSTSYRIKELDVHARIEEQVARVQVSQSFVNTGSQQMEVSFVFPLPYDGAIDQLTLLVDGKEFPARLLGKDEARRAYEAIVRKNRDPALLEWIGTGMFQTSVFPVPPGAERKVTLRYSQLCRKDHSLTDFLFPLSTAKYTSKPVEKVQIQVVIDSKIEIKNVYSPTHSLDVKRDPHHATVTYSAGDLVPESDFRLFYDVQPGQLGATVMSYRPKADEDGYLLMLASPQIKTDSSERPKKTVVFVVDRSGSMSGQKIEQAKGALKFVLNNLREGDLFNIVAYDSGVESFRPELQKYDEETRKAALGFVEGIYAGGSTNIDGALSAALGQLTDSSRPSYVLFLTDGLPTAGEINEMKIVTSAKAANHVHARIVAFGVGYDVNSRLLDKLARENFGQSEYVRPNEDIEDRVSRLYNRIQSPVMTDVAVRFSLDTVRTEQGEPVNRLYPRQVYDLFEGEQLVLVGRYKQSGAAKVTISGSVMGQSQSFDFPAELLGQSKDESLAFVEKLWAMRRIGEIIDEIDLKGRNEELIKELVDLSTRHGILTPYTSFLADENTRLGDVAANAPMAEDRLQMLLERSPEGRGGVAQRAAKAGLQYADRPLPGAAAGGALGAGGGNSFGAAGPSSNPYGGRGVARYLDAATDKEVTVESLRSVGRKSFFFRQSQWVDSTVTEELKQKAKRVEQFSDEYFRLADKHGRTLSQYLVFDEPVLVNLEGEVFLIEPAKN